MRTYVRFLFAAAIVLFTVQCQNREGPVALDESSWNALVIAATPEQIQHAQEIEQMIRDLFKSADEQTAVNKFCSAANDYVRGRITSAHNKLFDLIRFTLNKYRQNKLECGQSAECRQKLADLLNEEFDFFGIEHDPVPPEAFGPDGAAGTCGPSGCLLVTGTKFAGVRIYPNSVDRQFFMFIHRLPDSPGPLNTDLNQYPLFYFIGTDPEVNPDPAADVALCVLDNPPFEIGAPPGAELRIGHNVGESGFEFFPLGPSDFIDCTDAAPMAFHTPAWQGFFADALRPFSPSLLYAMPGELGSKASNFSPFGAVDIESEELIATETTLVADPDTVANVGEPFTLTATVSPAPAAGSLVEFYEVFEGGERNLVGTALTNSDGVAVLPMETDFECGGGACVGLGVHVFEADFVGTTTHAPSTSNQETVLVLCGASCA